MIKLNSIFFSDQEKSILDNIDLHINKNEKVVLTGPSGSGKSSILRVIIGAIIPTNGNYLFDGKLVDATTISQVRNNIAYIGQEPVLGTDLVQDALFLPFQYKIHKMKKPGLDRVKNIMRKLNLDPEILKQEVNKISGGEKQRLAIVRALLLEKSVFLLDEITSALDPESKQSVIEELTKPEFTLLSVSHDPQWISQCDKEIVVTNGRIAGSIISTDIMIGDSNGN